MIEFGTHKKSRLILGSFIVSGLIALLLALIFWFGAFETWEWRLEDKLFIRGEANEDIVIVAIDDASLQELGRWPWDREVMAELISHIGEASPSVLGVDVNFPEPAEGDNALAESLTQEFPVVLPIEAVLEIPTSMKRRSPLRALETLSPVTAISEVVELGATNTPPDADGIVRRIPIKIIDLENNFIKAFGAKIASFVQEEYAAPPVDNFEQILINYQGPGGTFESVSAKDVMSEEFDINFLENKIVLVGATAPDLHDTWFTPTAKSEPMPGIEVHANVVQTILNKDFLANAPNLLTLILIFVLAFALAFSSLFLKTRWNILMPLIMILVYLFVVVILFDFGIILNILYPLLAIAITFTSLAIYRYVNEVREKREIRNAFEFYLSPHVIEEVLKDPKKLTLGGRKKEMTVLFSDIRGFTSLSEGLSPEELTHLMNKYLTAMTEIVLAKDGVLDKYIGDALMAFWGAPLPQPMHAERACHAALAMIARLEKMNQEGVWPEGRKINIGIGVNSGEMVVGNMGAEKRFDYTVLGDAVNLGSRVESINKQYGTKIIITEFTKAEISDEFVTRYLDKVAVKGKTEPVKIYELVGYRKNLELKQMDIIELYEEAFGYYQKKKWDKAIEILNKYTRLLPDDLAAENLLERCKYYKKEPPPKAWDGTWIMKTK